MEPVRLLTSVLQIGNVDKKFIVGQRLVSGEVVPHNIGRALVILVPQIDRAMGLRRVLLSEGGPADRPSPASDDGYPRKPDPQGRDTKGLGTQIQ